MTSPPARAGPFPFVGARAVRRQLATLGLLVVFAAALLFAVPGLDGVVREIEGMQLGWGGIGVLDAGLAAALLLYGADPTAAIAAVLVYHALVSWIPGVGGLLALASLRRRIRRVR